MQDTISTPTCFLPTHHPSLLDPEGRNAFSTGSRAQLWSQNPAFGGKEKNKVFAQKNKRLPEQVYRREPRRERGSWASQTTQWGQLLAHPSLC